MRDESGRERLVDGHGPAEQQRRERGEGERIGRDVWGLSTATDPPNNSVMLSPAGRAVLLLSWWIADHISTWWGRGRPLDRGLDRGH